MYRRGIVWAPDTIVSAGGIVYATAVELDRVPPEQALQRVWAAVLQWTSTSGNRLGEPAL